MGMVTEVTLSAVGADGIPRFETVYYPEGYDSSRMRQDADDPGTILGQAQNRLDVFLTETVVPIDSEVRFLYEDFNDCPLGFNTKGHIGGMYSHPRNPEYPYRHNSRDADVSVEVK